MPPGASVAKEPGSITTKSAGIIICVPPWSMVVCSVARSAYVVVTETSVSAERPVFAIVA
ncbi:hypothetical protein D3C83_251400 [compost metagenome]